MNKSKNHNVNRKLTQLIKSNINNVDNINKITKNNEKIACEKM